MEPVSVTRHGMQSKMDADLGRMGKNEKGECEKGEGDERKEEEEERKRRERGGTKEGCKKDEGRDEGIERNQKIPNKYRNSRQTPLLPKAC